MAKLLSWVFLVYFTGHCAKRVRPFDYSGKQPSVMADLLKIKPYPEPPKK